MIEKFDYSVFTELDSNQYFDRFVNEFNELKNEVEALKAFIQKLIIEEKNESES